MPATLSRHDEETICVHTYEAAAGIPEPQRLTCVRGGRVSAKAGVPDAQLSSVAARYEEYHLFCRQVDDLVEAGAMMDRAAYASQHAFLSLHTPKAFLELGFRDNPFSITEGHLYDLFQPGPWDGGKRHSHGIPLVTVKRLPWLLERPALVANHNAFPDRVLAVLPDVDSRGLPLIASLIPDADGLLDLDEFITNQVATVFGPDNFPDYFGRALPEGNVIRIDSEQEAALRGKVGADPFPHLTSLSRDVQLAEPNDYVADRGAAQEPINADWLRERILERLDR